MPVWDPLQQQFAEADTLFKPTLTNQPTINAEGGFLTGANLPQADLVSRFDFGTGKFTPGVRPKAGQASYVFYPIDGLIAGDEFTLEYWQKLDVAWSAHNSGKALFALQGSTGGNYLRLFEIFGGNYVHRAGTMDNVPARAWTDIKSGTVASLGLVDLAWNNFAITLKAGVLTFYVNAVSKGTITGVNYLPIWSDTTKEEGVTVGGEPGANNNIWTSDIRISHTARVPGATPTLRSVSGTLAINATSTSGSVPTNYSGSLSIIRRQFNSEDIGAMIQQDAIDALEHTRGTAPFTDSPIKAGGTDGTHPTLGASGLFSYDWQVVDRSLNWWHNRGLEKYVGPDGTPQILGGSVVPDPVLHRLMGGTYDSHIPSSNSDFAAMVSDMVLHAISISRRIERLGSNNEPDIGAQFWQGSISQYMDLWHAWVTAAKVADSTVKVGGGEVSTIYATSWIDAFFAKKQAAGTAMDFFSVHDYSGSLTTLDQTRAIVDRYANDHSITPPPVVMGEYNWSNLNDQAGTQRFMDGFYHLRALNAAYLTAYHIHALDVGGIERLCWAHTGPAYGSPFSGLQYSTMILVGDNDEHWGTFNAMKGWKTTAHNRDLLTTTKTLPPGVYGVATKDPAATKYGLAFANWGWANRNSRTVNATISNLPAGNYRLRRYLVDETHSSRWDVAQDNPVGAPYDALAMVEERVDTAANLATLSITLPRWSSTFVTIEPADSGGTSVALTGTSTGSSTTTANMSGGSGPAPPPTTGTFGSQLGTARLGA